jgi:hypothetical protein
VVAAHCGTFVRTARECSGWPVYESGGNVLYIPVSGSFGWQYRTAVAEEECMYHSAREHAFLVSSFQHDDVQDASGWREHDGQQLVDSPNIHVSVVGGNG